ncbi:MAG: hypothetical protein HY735_08130 [Verrucomicrobia bacterium]|nr:hypothetical protein [Verrucomicrobiota bacterium]
MADQPPPNSLSLDTNLFVDLGGQMEYALAFLEIVEEHKAPLYATPTVLRELAALAIRGNHAEKQAALLALRSLGRWAVTGLQPRPAQNELTRLIASRILESDLLPRAEHNDSRIVAETSLAGVPYLVSNDNWVNGIDQVRLNRLLAGADFNPITIISPRRFLALLRRSRFY